MCQPVHERTGEAFSAKGFGPFLEWQVDGDQCGAAFVAL